MKYCGYPWASMVSSGVRPLLSVFARWPRKAAMRNTFRTGLSMPFVASVRFESYLRSQF